jgi:hypothetical protein
MRDVSCDWNRRASTPRPALSWARGGLRFMRDPTRGGQRWIDELEDDPLPRIC